MSILSGLATVAGAVGAVSSLLGTRERVRAQERQANRIIALSDEERGFLRRQAALEAELIEADAGDEAALARSNQRLALENADWARRAGGIALRQARRRWDARIGTMVADLGASGAALDAASPLLQDQVAQMREDLGILRLNARREAEEAERQAGFYSLRARQIEARAQRRQAARLELGEIEARIAGSAAASRAAAARAGARSAAITGGADLFRQATGLAGLLAGGRS